MDNLYGINYAVPGSSGLFLQLFGFLLSPTNSNCIKESFHRSVDNFNRQWHPGRAAPLKPKETTQRSQMAGHQKLVFPKAPSRCYSWVRSRFHQWGHRQHHNVQPIKSREPRVFGNYPKATIYRNWWPMGRGTQRFLCRFGGRPCHFLSNLPCSSKYLALTYVHQKIKT